MAKRVALVGHCGADRSYLHIAVASASRGIEIVSADDEQSLNRVLDEGVDLILFNRILDYGFREDEGVEMIRRLRAAYPKVKMMLVSNFADAQQAAIAAGAVPGFGKREIGSERMKQALCSALSD